MLDRVRQARIFTKLDLRGAYNFIRRSLDMDDDKSIRGEVTFGTLPFLRCFILDDQL
jgi:hypothetical protein